MITKMFKGVTLLLGGLFAFAFTMNAQSFETLHVPFAFTAGRTSLPAGDYSIKPSGDSGVLIIRGIGTGASVAVITMNVAAPVNENPGVIFARHGSEVVLTSVRLGGGMSRLLMISSRRTPSLAAPSAALLPHQ